MQNLKEIRVQVDRDYRFILPSGIYWIGDPTLAFPGATIGKTPSKTPCYLNDGVDMLIFNTYNNYPGYYKATNGKTYYCPSGKLAIMAPPENMFAPNSVSAHALFSPAKTSMLGGILSLGDFFKLDTSNGEKYEEEKVLGVFEEILSPSSKKIGDSLSKIAFEQNTTFYCDIPPGKYWVGDLLPNFPNRQKDVTKASEEHWFANNPLCLVGEEPVLAISTETENLIGTDGNVFNLSSGIFGLMQARKTPPQGGVHVYNFVRTTRVAWRKNSVKLGKTLVFER